MVQVRAHTRRTKKGSTKVRAHIRTNRYVTLQFKPLPGEVIAPSTLAVLREYNPKTKIGEFVSRRQIGNKFVDATFVGKVKRLSDRVWRVE